MSISRLVPRKGFDVAIEAAALLAPTRPDLLLAISGGGRDERRLRRLAAEREAPVRFLGRVANDDLPDLYGCADVFTMACRSRWGGLEQEGFGIVFVEAAACGVPQVAGDSGGAAEAVDDGVTGLVVRRPEDADEVAAAFEALLDDPAAARRDGRGVAASGPSPSSPTTCWPSGSAVARACGDVGSGDESGSLRGVATVTSSTAAGPAVPAADRPATSSSAPTSPARRCSPSTAALAAAFFTTFWQWVAAVTALVLFAIGVFAFLWSYYNAVQRSRTRRDRACASCTSCSAPPTPPRVRRMMLATLLVAGRHRRRRRRSPASTGPTASRARRSPSASSCRCSASG